MLADHMGELKAPYGKIDTFHFVEKGKSRFICVEVTNDFLFF